jgi:hypothetical protein
MQIFCLGCQSGSRFFLYIVNTNNCNFDINRLFFSLSLSEGLSDKDCDLGSVKLL